MTPVRIVSVFHMESAWLVLLAVVVGVVAGVTFTLMVVHSLRIGRRAKDLVAQEVPPGIGDVLLAFDAAGLVIDPSNTVMLASPSAVSMGLVQDRMLVHDPVREVIEKVRRDGETVTETLTLSRGPFGDESLHVRATVAPVGVRYLVVLIEDQTESLRLEDVRRDFMANISHELKTPIGAIGLLSEALVSAADDPEQVQRFATRLTSESDRLRDITHDIIELSRLQAVDVLRAPKPVDVDYIVTSAIEQNHVLAANRHIEVAHGGSKKARVFGDEALLLAAVANLVSNAIQYSPDNSRVGVGVRKEAGVVEIAVTDQGVGIAEDELSRVFERFYRVDPARSRVTGGTGLGLSIVKHVVQNHGGEVRAWSRPGRGSTFTIRIPEASESRAAALGLEKS